MPTFDLLTERWIPIVRIDGTSDEVGLREALLSAHEIAEIRDPMPTVEFGLYRLLVALTTDIFELREVSELADLLHAGEFAAGRIEAYLGQWHDRFDLFHPKHPFLQMAAMAGEEKPVAALLPVVPSGTNAIHFYHQSEGSFGIAPGTAARLLTAVAPFMTAGGAGLSPSICGAPPWYVLVVGRSLLETLCLNRCAVPPSTSGGDAPPAWRDPRALPAGEGQTG